MFYMHWYPQAPLTSEKSCRRHIVFVVTTTLCFEMIALVKEDEIFVNIYIYMYIVI